MLQANPEREAGQRSPGRASGLMSLRVRLLLLVVASIVPLFAFTLASQYLQYRDAITSAGRQTLELAHSLSLLVEQDLQTRMVALQVLALSPALRSDDLATFRAEAEAAIAQQFPGSNLILLQEN